MTERPKRPSSPRALLAPRAAALLAELRRVRRSPDDADAIHDARVAARRLRAAAELWLPAGAPRERLFRRLDKAIRRLGRVRNLDVAMEFLRLGPEEDARERRRVRAEARRRRKAEQGALEGWLTERRLRRLKEAAIAAMEERDRRRVPDPSDLGPRLRRIAALARGGRILDDPARAHELRREIRLLRYAHESLGSEYGPAAFEAVRRSFVEAQDAAGEWHDRQVLLRLAARAARRGVPTSRLDRRLREEQERLGEAFVAAVERLLGRKPELLGETS